MKLTRALALSALVGVESLLSGCAKQTETHEGVYNGYRTQVSTDGKTRQVIVFGEDNTFYVRAVDEGKETPSGFNRIETVNVPKDHFFWNIISPYYFEGAYKYTPTNSVSAR